MTLTFDYKFVQGLRYQHYYESHYSSYRRFLISNPNVSLATLKKLIQVHKEKKEQGECTAGTIKHINLCKFVCETLLDNCHDRSYESRRGRTRFSFRKPKKHCPDCARVGFHTELFEHNGCNNCPWHKCSLLNTCPDCGKPWPSTMDLITRHCSTCGRSASNHYLLSAHEFQPINIEKLLELFEFSYNSYTYCSFNQYGGENSRSQYPDVFLCEYQHHLHPSTITNEILLDVNAPRTNLMQAPIGTNIRKRKKNKTKHENFIKKHYTEDRLIVCRKVHSWIRKHAHKNHHLTSFKFINYGTDGISKDDIPCVHCLAYHLWFSLMTGGPIKRFYSHRILRHIDPNFYHQHIHPHDKYVEVSRGCHSTHELNQKTIRWLYKRDLWAGFLRLTSHLYKLMEDECLGVNHLTYLSLTDDTVKIFKDDKGHLIALFSNNIEGEYHKTRFEQPPNLCSNYFNGNGTGLIDASFKVTKREPLSSIETDLINRGARAHIDWITQNKL